ncbi:hypothetical protein CJF31_00003041 [Rutstroemia sp. NJR-2017a BVV2]|nr:hypothetical protein CJF31_00001833 [Rutstroemia sp. NJR-2017a BVV2]PQE18377.1 hypothetical protein CJF31_00003041 [Rutstroemia sp. NJR-2017a BVV2]
MAAYDFPGIDFSLPFHPAPHNISVHSPFKYSSPKPYLETSHDYGTFSYPLTPDSEVHPLRNPEFSPEAESFYHSSSSSSSTSRSSLCSSVSPLTPEPSKVNDARVLAPINTNIQSLTRSSAPVDMRARNSGPRDYGLRRSAPSNARVTVYRPLKTGLVINTNTNTNPAASTFPHFTSLPMDLQRRVWELTLPPPRIIELHHHDPPPTTNPATLPPASLSSTLPLPLALRIHRLSRRVALAHYTALSLCHPYYLPALPYTYIDYSRDTIYLSSATVYESLGTDILYSRNLNQIHVLALDFKVWVGLLRDNHFVNALLEMEGLGEGGLVVVFERGVLGWRFEGGRRMSRGRGKGELRFSEVRQEEMSAVEEVFERECEKCWLWGRVKGWEDVRAKLRFRWKEEGGVVDEEEVQDDDDLYGYSGVEPRMEELKGLGLGMGTGMRKESVDLSVQSLLLSVDDVLEEYGAMAQVDTEVDTEVEEVEGDVEFEYSESEYSVQEGEEGERERGWDEEDEEEGLRDIGFGEMRGLGFSQREGLGISEKRGLGIITGRGGNFAPVDEVDMGAEAEDERDWDYGFEEEGNWI